MQKILFFILLICFIACSKNHDGSIINTTDVEFMQQVSLANYAAIDAATIADTNADDASVKSFAANALTTHNDIQNNLISLAAHTLTTLPDEADSAHKNKAAHLATLKEEAFDKAYINAQVNDYNNTVALFNNELSNGNNTLIINFARTYLPEIVRQSEKAADIQALMQ